MLENTLLIDGGCLLHRYLSEGTDIAKEKIDSLIRDLRDFCGLPEYRIYLSEGINFRHSIAKTRPYKGTRKDKPENYQEVRDFIIESYNVEIVLGYEEDDALGVNQSDSTIIATIDKDLNQIPGKLINFYKTPWEIKEITEEDGIRFFWEQMILGDSVDNIVGVEGIGKVKMAKLFDGKSVSELKEIVVNEYNRCYGEQGLDRFDESARLLFIKRGTYTSEYYDYV